MTFLKRSFLFFFLFLFTACSSLTPVSIEHRNVSSFDPLFSESYQTFSDFYGPISYFEITDPSSFVSFDVTMFEWKESQWIKSLSHTIQLYYEPVDLFFGISESDCALYIEIAGSEPRSTTFNYDLDVSGLAYSPVSFIQVEESSFVPIMAFYEEDQSYSFTDFQKDLGDFSGRYAFLCLSFSQV